MEIKSLVLGLLFSVGVFALKAGFGIQYRQSAIPPGPRKIAGEIIFITLYAAVFYGAAVLARRMDLSSFHEKALPLLKGGMVLHLIMAALLLTWGMMLLKRKTTSETSRGWLLLAIPCPVCMTVILFSTAFTIMHAPDHSRLIPFLLFAAFMLIAFTGRQLMASIGSDAPERPEDKLGLIMTAIAAYFLITALIAPQFADLGRVYRLAVHSGLKNQIDMSGLIIPLALTITVFAGGLWTMKKRMDEKHD